MTAGSGTLKELARLPASRRLAAHQRGRAIKQEAQLDYRRGLIYRLPAHWSAEPSQPEEFGLQRNTATYH